MKKNAFYFSHDANARNDQKMIQLRMKYGMKGYGIFFGIVELLMEANGYQLPKNWEAIAYDLRENAIDIEDVVLNYGLFTVNGKTFWSGSLKDRMAKREELSRVRSDAGKLGGNKAKVKRALTPKVPFKVPTVEEVKEYCLAEHVIIDHQKFTDYYSSNGWKVGKNPMKDWKAAARGWAKSAYNTTTVHQEDGIDPKWKTPVLPRR